MNTTFVTIGLFMWLAGFLGIGWVINRVMKRPAVNAAGLYAIAVLAVMAINIAIVVNASSSIVAGASSVPEMVGAIIGSFLLPLLLAAFLSQRFQKRKKQYIASMKDIVAS